ncbi:MAG: hypothetical protein GY940_33500 [bacterium]|nr:hypothetical protein [bacterium]
MKKLSIIAVVFCCLSLVFSVGTIDLMAAGDTPAPAHDGHKHKDKKMKKDGPKLCGECGQIKGSKVCCAKDAKMCSHCKLAKDSPGCCKMEKGKDVALCTHCGQMKGSKMCCKPGAKKCSKCKLAKGSPGCCKINKKKAKA